MKRNIELTGIFVQDPYDKGYTAFFAQLPNIVAEGTTKEEATQKLFETVQVVFNNLKNEEKDVCDFQKPPENVTTQQFNLQMS